MERNSDQATYTCVAKNAEGYSARGALEVQVMGKLRIEQFMSSCISHWKKLATIDENTANECSIVSVAGALLPLETAIFSSMS